MEVKVSKIIDHNTVVCFSEILRDDLAQMKSDIRNMSEKLEAGTLKSFETGHTGQFQDINF